MTAQEHGGMRRSFILFIALGSLLGGCGRGAAPESSAGDTLEEEHAEGETGESHAEISPEAARASGILIETVGSRSIREVLPLYGSIQPDTERVRNVSARYPGIVRSVRKRIGDTVAEGEALASIESNESLQTYPVVAPIAGVITARNANPGETAGEAPLFVVSDLSTVWAELNLFPRDRDRVRIGQTARVMSADGEAAEDGRVIFVSALGSATTQSLTVRVLLPNGEKRWTPGLYVTGELVVGEASVPAAVKASALQTLDRQTVVFVPDERGFQAREIKPGREEGDWIEVLSGLQAGEKYVAEGSFIVKAEIAKGEAAHEH